VFPVDFGYVRAASLEHALAELAGAGDAKLIAGGQSLLPMMKLRLAAPETLVDIGGLPELTGISGAGAIGAATTYRALRRDQALMAAHPAFADALAVLADPQVRARGTIGGAVAHADPAADLPAVLLALDAELTIAGSSGTRTTTLDDFLQGAYTTDLDDTEILTAITVAPHGPGQAYEKFEQPASHLPLAGVCAALTITDGVIAAARLTVTGVAARAFKAQETERRLAGHPATPEAFAAAASAVADLPDGLAPLSDQHASGEFRLHLAEVLARRALTRALERAA
jgi:carbon-monoxide dehydrogenase medium subunit